MNLAKNRSDEKKLQSIEYECIGKRQPLVSIVVVTHHRKKELKQALDSILFQTWKHLEVILVDDNGDSQWNQKVEHIVEEWENNCTIPLKYIKNENNCGSATSRNKGIQAALGEYITFLDDDDTYMPQKIENQMNHMIRVSSEFSITDLALYNEEGKLEEKRVRNYLKDKAHLMSDSALEEYVYNGDCVKELLAKHLMYHMTGTDTLMFKREYLEKIGGFPHIDMGDEFYLMKEAVIHEGRFSYLPVCDVKALVHSKTEGLSSRERKVKGENKLYEYKKQFFPTLTKKQVKKIRMRHHLVLAYAYLRNRNYGKFFVEGCQAMATEPVACIRMVIERKS